ncbi:Mbov_0400 family ICE element protein [Mycoplasma procyoni]|uniref:Mbov_0400 family ICE element protein n=1 Tax=Mycoplasma procyoni TaxID=568784 RepID=UPI00197CB04F|nr:hypothetical protein [Mycoplasma procyoni]MBN3534669.1 hypothetical protein [Mycoplasma procyoni]
MKKTQDKRLKQIMQEKNIIFNEFEMKISNHPIIIFTDWYGDLYYLKTRSAYDIFGIKKEKGKFEIEIPVSAITQETSITKDFYLDTARIYKIKEEEFDLVYNNKKNATLCILNKEYGDLAFEKVIENFNQQPPIISFIEVIFNEDKNAFDSFTIYSQEDVLKEEIRYLNKNAPENYEKITIDILQKSQMPEITESLKELKLLIESEHKDYMFQFYDRENEPEDLLGSYSFKDFDFKNIKRFVNLEQEEIMESFNKRLQNFNTKGEIKDFVFFVRTIDFFFPEELGKYENLANNLLVLLRDEKVEKDKIFKLKEAAINNKPEIISQVVKEYTDKNTDSVEFENN